MPTGNKAAGIAEPAAGGGQEHSFREEPRNEDYVDLVTWAARFCTTALVVLRSGCQLEEAGLQLLARLQPHIASDQELSCWPGTRLLSESAARVINFEITESVIRELTTATVGLFGWMQPGLPEDLCFIRSNGSPYLTSISHERDAFLTLMPEDLKHFSSKAPPFARLLAPPVHGLAR